MAFQAGGRLLGVLGLRRGPVGGPVDAQAGRVRPQPFVDGWQGHFLLRRACGGHSPHGGRLAEAVDLPPAFPKHGSQPIGEALAALDGLVVAVDGIGVLQGLDDLLCRPVSPSPSPETVH